MKYIAALLLLVLPVSAEDNLISGFPESFRPTKQWQLVDSATAVEGKAALTLTSATEGKAGILINTADKTQRAPYLMTKEEFTDVELEIEFMVPKSSNSGLYFMGRYEVQILDSYGREKFGTGDLGGIYQRWNYDEPDKKKRGYEGSAPAVNAARKPGEWQTIKVHFQAPRFDENGKKRSNALFVSVHVNGQLVQENVHLTGPTRAHPLKGEEAKGPLAIQGDHGPIAIRKLTIKPL